MAAFNGSTTENAHEFVWSDVLAAEENVHQSIASNMASRGYVVLKVDSSMASVMNKIRKKSKKFFNSSSIAEKKELCCEYIGEKPQSARDRLEIRVARGAQKTAFVALKRDQFASGYASQASSVRASETLAGYFGNHLLEMHELMEEMADQLLAIFCRFIDYNEFKGLKSLLAKETETPGVLRLMRYAERAPVETSGSGVSELAIDHTDIGLITLMPYSPSGTLQILSPEFDWLDVEQGKSPGTIVAIVGEQLAYLSNYRFQAVRHRVIPGPPNVQRFSFPFLMRAPPEYELVQAGDAGKCKIAKQILNHIFDLPMPLQTVAKHAIELETTFRLACAGSKRDTAPIATCVANPKRNSTICGFWPIVLFFNRGLPSSRAIARLTDSWTHGTISYAKQTLQKTDKPEILVRKEGLGWSVEHWPDGIQSMDVGVKQDGKTLGLRVYLISWRDHVEGTKSKCDDLTWTVRCSLVVSGRSKLESAFDMNSHRIE